MFLRSLISCGALVGMRQNWERKIYAHKLRLVHRTVQSYSPLISHSTVSLPPQGEGYHSLTGSAGGVLHTPLVPSLHSLVSLT